MATQITRPTRTDDTGTPASPNNDGDIIDAGTFSELEDNIDTMWSGATQVFGGIISAETAGTHALSAGTSGTNILVVRNTTDASGASAQVRVGNDAAADVTIVSAQATSFTPAGENLADGSTVEGTRAGGLSLAATHASGDVRIYAAGSTKLITFDGDAAVSSGGIGGSHAYSGVLRDSVNTTAAGTPASTTQTTLHSFSLPAGALAVDGQGIRIHAAFKFAANNNSRTVGVDFGAAQIFGTAGYSGSSVTATGAVRLVADIFRVDATNQKAIAQVNTFPHDTGNYSIGSNHAEFTEPTETLSGAITIAIWGTNGTAAANDIECELSYVEYLA